jgi:Zn-dependent protease with chaperone function
VILFSLAVLLLIVLVNGLITAFLWFGRDYNLYVGRQRLGGLPRPVLLGALRHHRRCRGRHGGLVSLVRWLQLASGGKTVAESMGGRRVLRQSDDPDEKRCLNIVEELALAANMPVPALYVLPDERGINAFAAGVNPADAVVAVTRGALLQLKRDELQGVIGHEFSHILNGDMRLGIRLASLLKGITFIGDVGHFLLRAGAYGIGRAAGARAQRSAADAWPRPDDYWLAGFAVAGFIKAAISRQKEYLADASAVQFTRDNRGIANALKVIGGYLPGSLVHAARAPEMSHIFFGEVTHGICGRAFPRTRPYRRGSGASIRPGTGSSSSAGSVATRWGH